MLWGAQSARWNTAVLLSPLRFTVNIQYRPITSPLITKAVATRRQATSLLPVENAPERWTRYQTTGLLFAIIHRSVLWSFYSSSVSITVEVFIRAHTRKPSPHGFLFLTPELPGVTMAGKPFSCAFCIALCVILAQHPVNAQDNRYVGSETCKECHSEEYASYKLYAKKSKSSHSIKILSQKAHP